MKLKKLFSVVLTLALLASLLCAAAAPAAAEVSDWNALSAALAKGGDVKLVSDVTAPEARTCILEVPAGVRAALDLNGFTLDGGTPGDEDCVVRVYGTFTLSDSSAGGTGRLTGTRDGVDVYGGAFTLTGGTVDGCGNFGVFAEDGVLTMTGGTIRDSYLNGLSAYGEKGAIYFSGGEISGSQGYPEDGLTRGGVGLEIMDGHAEITGGVISGCVFGVKTINASLLISGGELRDCCCTFADEGSFYGGAGVYAYNSTVSMTGGAVSDSEYAGLYIDDGTTFKFSGGAVSGEGGMYAAILPAGTLALSGGTISGGDEHGVWLFGGELRVEDGTISGSQNCGVIIDSGAFSMSGGTISDCGWCGVFLGGGSAVMSGGAISDCANSGVILNSEDASFRMSGGTISGSEGYMSDEDQWYYYGTGVEVIDGHAEISGGEIYDNVTGVELVGGSAVMTGGEIRDTYIACELPEEKIAFGGTGVDVSYGTFTMTGGELRDNEVGGVNVNYSGSAAVSGGTISGRGAGLMLQGGELSIEGSPVVTGNLADVYLHSDMRLTIGGPLALGKPLSVYLKEAADGGSVEVPVTTGLPGNGSAESFTYSGVVYEIVSGDDGEAKAVYRQYFPDVKGDEWYATAVSYAAVSGIFEGTDKGFEPDLKLTRAMAVQALWNFAGKPASAAAIPFGDVKEDAWYADAVRWAVETGVVDAAETFDPTTPVSREEFAVLFYRYMQSLGEGFKGMWSFRLDFADVGDLSSEAVEAVSWCVMNGIIEGVADRVLAPQHTITRAQAATILMRLYNLNAKHEAESAGA